MDYSNTQSGFTQLEAESFVKLILEEIVQLGKIESVDNFYTEDVIGHYGNEIFKIKDMKARFLALYNNSKKIQLHIGKVTLIDQFIMYSCKHDWIDKKDKNFHSLTVFTVYRMRDKKISEVWTSFDTPMATSYKEASNKFMESMKPFELNFKSKQEFLSKIKLVESTHLSENNKLTKIERECLYYYLNGFSSKETANAMSLSHRTIECHLSQIKDKFDCRNKLALRKKIFPVD